jgi:hypothetical protein
VITKRSLLFRNPLSPLNIYAKRGDNAFDELYYYFDLGHRVYSFSHGIDQTFSALAIIAN